ncbi:MAG TPA: hypothetical protein VER83_05680 [Candidatus Nanopelagicales bacterium]|nr:hypothetical protein [Candidatus Nanopelagicales bacterium]
MHAPLLARHGRRGTRVLVAAALAGAAIGLGFPGGTGPGDAADRFVAGGPTTERAPLAAEQAAPVLAAASASRRRLGLPGPSAVRVDRVTDRFSGMTYDEVTATDGAGRTLHLQRFDARGRLVGAVSFGWQSGGGRPMPDAASARARGSRLATDLGLGVSGAPDVRREPDDSGWAIAWPRLVDGIPVLGDGVRIDLWPDGRVHAVVRGERPLASRPSILLDEATARQRATVTLADLFGNRAGQITIAAVGLGWVAPNDAFDPTGPDAPASTLRLAWVVEARTGGELAEGLRAVKIFLDAGTGALLGGDVLR